MSSQLTSYSESIWQLVEPHILTAAARLSHRESNLFGGCAGMLSQSVVPQHPLCASTECEPVSRYVDAAQTVTVCRAISHLQPQLAAMLSGGCTHGLRSASPSVSRLDVAEMVSDRAREPSAARETPASTAPSTVSPISEVPSIVAWWQQQAWKAPSQLLGVLSVVRAQQPSASVQAGATTKRPRSLSDSPAERKTPRTASSGRAASVAQEMGDLGGPASSLAGSAEHSEEGAAEAGHHLGARLLRAATCVEAMLHGLESPSAVMAACSRLRPWQQRVLGSWIVSVLPRLCPLELQAACTAACEAGSGTVLLMQDRGASSSAGVEGQALSSWQAALNGLAPPASSAVEHLSSASTAWLLLAVDLLRSLHCECAACALVLAPLLALVQAGVPDSAPLWPHLALLDSISAPLAALDLAEPVAASLLRAAVPLLSSRSATRCRATELAAAAWRLVHGGPECSLQQLKSALSASSKGADVHLLLTEADASALAGGVRETTCAAFLRQRSALPQDTSMPPVELSALQQADLSRAGDESAAKVLQSLAAADASASPLVGVLRAADALVATATTRDPTAPATAANLLPGLTAFEVLLSNATPGDSSVRHPIAATCALYPSIASAVAAAADEGSTSRAVAGALAVTITAVAVGAMHLPTLLLLCQEDYDKGSPGSHLLLAALLSDLHPSGAKTNTLLVAVRQLLIPGAAAVLEAAQRQLPGTSFPNVTGDGDAKRSLLPDAMSAPGAAGARAGTAASMLLACDATRLALLASLPQVPLHGSHLEGTAQRHKVHPAWAVMVMLHTGCLLKMNDIAGMDWSVCIATFLALSTGAAQLQAEHLVAIAVGQLAVNMAQHTSPALIGSSTQSRATLTGKQAEMLATAMLAALLLRPSSTAAIMGIADAQGGATKKALFALLKRGMEPGSTAGEASSAKMLTGQQSVIAALADAAAVPPAVCGAASMAAPAAQQWFVDMYLQLLSDMEPAMWRDRAESLVSQLSALADAAIARSRCPSAVERKLPSGLTGLAAAVAQLEVVPVQPEQQAALWVRIEALMPLAPIVYNARVPAAGKNLRLRLPLALTRLIAAGDAAAQPPRKLPWDTLRNRMLVLLHMLLLDEWARWIECHQTKRKMQAIGSLAESSAVLAAAQDASVLPSTLLALASALDVPVPVKWNASALPSPPPLSATDQQVPTGWHLGRTVDAEAAWRAPWQCTPPLKGGAVWNASRSVFEVGGSHEALAHAPRTSSAAPRFAAMLPSPPSVL